MIKPISSVLRGLCNVETEQLKGSIAEWVIAKIEEADVGREKAEKQSFVEHDNDLRHIFGDNHLTINEKNIEYIESFYLSDYVMSDKIKEKLWILDWSDIFITLTVYRLGQYSYWTVEVNYVLAKK